MKYLIVFLVFFAVSARAQIALEHDYSDFYPRNFNLIQIDSGEWRYVNFRSVLSLIDTTYKDSISIYNLDHSLDRVIVTPTFGHYEETPIMIAKNLFDLDGDYTYMYHSYDTLQGLQIFKENGTLLFSCNNCGLYDIQSTTNGTKMLTSGDPYGIPPGIKVYSLPGKLPGSSTTLGVTNPSIISGNPSLPTSAYPNPSNGRVRITYELPPGVLTGQIILLTEDGKEVKRYQVTNAFNDLLIEESDLPSGSYFYKLVTDKGESHAKRIVRLK